MFLHMKWANAIKIGRKDRWCSSQCSHNSGNGWTPQVKFVVARIGNISCTAITTWNWNLSSKCVSYPHQQLGERKSTYKLDSTRAGQWTKSHTLFAPLSICSVGDMKAMNSLTAFLQLRSHRCIHLTFSWNDKMLDGTSPHHRRIKLHVTVMVLW